MAVTHTAADAIAATTMTNAVADIEQETPEIEKERQLAGVGAGAGTVANGKKKPHDHALASILGPAFVAAVATSILATWRPTSPPARDTATCWCGCWCSPTP